MALRSKLEYLRHSTLKTYFDARASEPREIGAIIDHCFEHLGHSQDLLISRLIELGKPASDEMVSRLEAAAIPAEDDASGWMEYRALLTITGALLRATNDPRLVPGGILTPERHAFLARTIQLRLPSLDDSERRIRWHWATRMHWHVCENMMR